MSDGILNVLKPPGMTSHDVISRIRRIYDTKKAGHSGTLDPDAAGVLPVFIGNATRLLEYAAEGTKEYRAEGMLGVRTDTGDDSGSVTERKQVPAISGEQFEKCLSGFCGKILQVPPMYSALKINGKKLYEYARQGVTVERAARPAEIFRLEALRFVPPYFCLEVECSKGTYIRTLLEDIAASLGTCACMTFLLRTRVGMFRIEEACTLEEIEARPETALRPLETAAAWMNPLSVNELQAYRITSGVKTTVQDARPGRYSLYCRNRFLGIVRVEDEVASPLKILFHAEKPDVL